MAAIAIISFLLIPIGVLVYFESDNRTVDLVLYYRDLFPQNKENVAEKAIVDQAIPLIQECEKIGGARSIESVIQGNILIFDVDENSRSNTSIPHGYTSISTDEQLTLLLVLNKTSIVVGSYTNGGGLALQPTANIAVVYWPSLEPVAFYHVLGTYPPSSVSSGDNHQGEGNLEDGITEWLGYPPWRSFRTFEIAGILTAASGVMVFVIWFLVVWYRTGKEMRKTKQALF